MGDGDIYVSFWIVLGDDFFVVLLSREHSPKQITSHIFILVFMVKQNIVLLIKLYSRQHIYK